MSRLLSRALNMSSKNHVRIVALETFFMPLPETLAFPANITHTVTAYSRTAPSEVASRIRDADIVISTIVPIRADVLAESASPNLRFINVTASGTDSIDLDACRSRGIRVVNSPGCNVDVVAEHALASYLAVRRSIVLTMRGLRDGSWPREGSLMMRAFSNKLAPRGLRDEVVALVGYGGVGQKIEGLFRALGVSKIMVAARKGGEAPQGRDSFESVLAEATVVVVACPRTPETLGMFSTAEFAAMRPDSIIVNVARGGIVDEHALLAALQESKIGGAATDVFDQEPASPETSLLLSKEAEGLNLVVTPHIAWVGMDTQANYQRVLQENLNDFFAGTQREDRIKA